MLKEFTLASYDAILSGLKSLDPATLDDVIQFHKWMLSRRVILKPWSTTPITAAKQ